MIGVATLRLRSGQVRRCVFRVYVFTCVPVYLFTCLPVYSPLIVTLPLEVRAGGLGRVMNAPARFYFTAKPRAGMGGISGAYNQASKNASSSSPLISSATAIKSSVLALPP